ncbi:MAG: hypothetical protein ISS16_08525 [Ignavibacteria bacterium]|nr:hypothetical protein [Ignavibacteria bacterium]
MNPQIKNLLFFFCIILCLVGNVFSQSKGDVSEVPKIDGKINQSEWAGAKIFNDFYLTIPKSDGKNYDSTIVYVKQSRDALYFAFQFHPKSKVISQSLVRDRSTDEENETFIVLDLENKNQNGYLFVFSFLDNQRDMLIYNQKSTSSEWDWVWECKSTVYREAKDGEHGYIESEIKIPVDRIQNKNTKKIGIDIVLFAYRPDGTYYFYSINPDSELMSVKNTYELDIEPFNERLNLDFNATPFVVGDKFNDSTYKAQLGGELTLSLDKHKLKSTYNTDESTLEADPFTFSFYDQPIFLQEKRPFFSKDLDIYSSPINLFYTRAIYNINLGFNYTYRGDRLKAGAIFVEEEPDPEGNKRLYFVARPKYYADDFSLGSFFLYSKDKTRDYQERIISMDGFYRFPYNRVRLLGQYVTNMEGNAYKFYAYYQYDESGGPYADLSYTHVDSRFNASTSFDGQVGLPNDYDKVYVSGGYKWVFNRSLFSDINVSGGYYRARILSDDFRLQDRLNLNMNTKIIGPLNFSTYLEYNRPDDYDENDNVIKRSNLLQEYSFRYLFGSNSVNAGYFFGTYYGSYINNPYIGLSFILFDRLSFDTDINFLEFFGESGTIINARFDYQVLKKLYLRAFYQKDTYSEDALLNAMVQYEFFAGSNVYFVLNLEGEKLHYTRRYFKISYEFNF